MRSSIGQRICRIGEDDELAKKGFDEAVVFEFRNLVADNFADLRKLIRVKGRQIELVGKYLESISNPGFFSKLVRGLQRRVHPSGYLRRQLLEDQYRQQKLNCEVEVRILEKMRDSLNSMQSSWIAKDSSTDVDPDSPASGHKGESSVRVMIDLRNAATDGRNGGLQVYVEWLVRWCRDQVPQPVCFVAIASAGNWQYVANLLGREDVVTFEGASNRVVREGGEGKPSIVATTLSVEKLIKAAGVDVLYCPLQEFPFWDSDVPSVVLLVDLLHREFPSALPSAECERREALFRDASKHATRIQCISDSSLELLEKHFPESAGKTFRTYLPVQERLDDEGSRRSEIGPEVEAATSGNPYFFYPANLWPHKNHKRLLEALAKYREECQDEPWKLVLTGADSVGRKAGLEEIADDLGLGDALKTLGYVSDEELSHVWRGASALVFPSLHEGFGIPLLEAMRYEIPILCSNSYSLSEVAGDAALYFDPDSPEDIARRMVEIHGDPDVGPQLVKKGKQRLADFDPEKEALLLVGELKEAAFQEVGDK